MEELWVPALLDMSSMPPPPYSAQDQHVVALPMRGGTPHLS